MAVLGTSTTGKKKIYHTTGGGAKGSAPERIVASPWNPGRCQPSKRFIYR